MNYKRALGFGILLWVFVFVIISILIFMPFFKDSSMRVNIAWWVIQIPLVLLMAKWYFKQKQPSLKEGFYLGLIALVIGAILDAVITVPLFIKSYSGFFGNWEMYVGYAELLLLTTLAGWEFDGPVAKIDKNQEL